MAFRAPLEVHLLHPTLSGAARHRMTPFLTLASPACARSS